MNRLWAQLMPLIAAFAFAGSVGCSSTTLNEARALDQLKVLDDLPVPPDQIKILGITEGEAERIVKVDFGGKSLNVKFRRFDSGWLPEQLENAGGDWVDLKTGLAMWAAIEFEAEQRAVARYLRGIASGQAAYSAGCGEFFYAPSLAALATPPKGERTAFVVDELRPLPGNAYVELEHYRIEIQTTPSAKSPASCNGVPAGASAATWAATAVRLKGYRGNSFQIGADGEISVIP